MRLRSCLSSSRWCSSPRLLVEPSFLSLWESAVSVRSDFGYASSRESLACVRGLVADVVGGDDDT